MGNISSLLSESLQFKDSLNLQMQVQACECTKQEQVNMDTINQSQLYSGWVLVGCMIWEGIGDGVIRVQWAPALCGFLLSDL